MKIGNKLALGFSIIIILSVISGLFSIHNVNNMSRIFEKFYMHPYAVSKAMRDIKFNIVDMHHSMKDVLLADNDSDIQEAEAKVSSDEHKVFSSFIIVFEQFLGSKENVQSAYDLFVGWKPIRDEIIRLMRVGKTAEAKALSKGRSSDRVDMMDHDIQMMISFTNQKGMAYHNEADEITNATIKNTIIIMIAIVIFGLMIAGFITLTITSPIRAMVKVADKLTKGDLSARNTKVTKAETGILASTINALADSVENRTIIQEGIAEISKIMIGKSVVKEFAESLLKHLTKLGNANMSTFYTLNESTMEFEHFASIGASEGMLKPFNAKNPQGEFGNAISTKKVFVLQGIPEDSKFNFITVAGEIAPKEIITIPILVNDVVVAIISLISITEFSTNYLEIISRSWVNINTSYSNLLSGERTQILAEHLSIINTKLESQSGELQEQSEELQEQTEELQHSAKELQDQNFELEVQKTQVEAANKLKSEFLSNMSHELRTPLNSIMALSQVLIMQAKDKLNAEEKEYLNIVRRNGNNLLTLINDILDLSKVEAGKMEVVPLIISLRQLLITTKENLQTLSDEKGIKFVLVIPDDLPNIESDEMKIRQILTNVIGNAIKFTEVGSVEVTATYDAQNVYVSIVDTGIGISKEMLPHIFDEFRQADGSTSRKFEGTGLGLAIASKIAVILGGNISVKTVLGSGSEFNISLPIRWHNENIPSATVDDFDEHMPPDTGAILVVDDDPFSAKDISNYLDEEGYNTINAYSGKTALIISEKYQPVAIILDMLMPEMDGWEVLQQLKTNTNTKDIPVIILALTDEQDTGFALGALGFLHKPVDKDMVISEVNRVLRYSNDRRGEPGQTMRNTTHRILLVEDNPDSITQLKVVLEKAHYQVDVATGGQEAIDYVSTTIPDGIILDLMMPDIDGFEVLEKIRHAKKTKSIPVLILTAKDLTKKDIARLSSNNVKQLIHKGDVDIEGLLSQVRSMLNLNSEAEKL